MARKAQNRKPQNTNPSPRSIRWFPIALILVVIVGAYWLFVGGGQGGSGPPPTHPELQEVLATTDADPSVGVALGPEGAPITIEEFYDPSCPACASFSGFAGKLIRQNYVETAGAPVRWITYNLILGSFPNSVAAALAERCAHAQGLYWPMHDLLLARQTRWYVEADPGSAIAEIASDAGVEPEAFQACMRERSQLEEVAKAHQVAMSRGVNSTPTLFVDGVRVSLQGVEPYTFLEGLIQARLEEGSADDGSSGDTP